MVPDELQVLLHGDDQILEETYLIVSVVPNIAGAKTPDAIVASSTAARHHSWHYLRDWITLETSVDQLWAVAPSRVHRLAARVVHDAFDYAVEPTAESMDLANNIVAVFVAKFDEPLVLANFEEHKDLRQSIWSGADMISDASTLASLLVFGDEHRVGVLLHRMWD